MLLKKLIYKFTQGDIYGIEVLNVKDEQRFFVTLCNVKKGKLNFVECNEFNNKEELLNYMSPNIPCCFNITGNGIINKQVEQSNNYKEKVLFNSKPSSFYWEEYYQEKDIFLSVARKELIDTIIADFIKVKCKIVHISIGEFGLQVFKNITSSLSSNTLYLEVNNGKITHVEPKNDNDVQTLDLGDQEISSKYALGFAAIANYVFPSSDTKSIEKNQNLKEEYLYAKATRKIGIPFVIGLFICLLAGYFILGILNQHIDGMSIKKVELIQLSKLLERKKQDKIRKEEILNQSGIANKHFISFYVLKLIEALPKGINLGQLDVFPIRRKIEKQKQVVFENNKLSIEGTVANNEKLNTWIKKIKNYDWVYSVEVKDFKKEKYSNSFELQITITK